MALFTDATYLREEQYKTPANLSARADLHLRFSTAPGTWPGWLMDQLDLQVDERVLEVGGGPGGLWRHNRQRLPAGLRLCFSDFSLGMLHAARAGLAGAGDFSFANADAQNLPLPAGAFDLVVANHMLYHVPDLRRAVRELARVLRPGGRLCAATNGALHMTEFYALVHGYDARYPGPDQMAASVSYRLENAADKLSPAFARVEVRRRPDRLWVTDADALVDYALSTSAGAGLAADGWPEGLRSRFQKLIADKGGLEITKDTGAVLAWNN